MHPEFDRTLVRHGGEAAVDRAVLEVAAARLGDLRATLAGAGRRPHHREVAGAARVAPHRDGAVPLVRRGLRLRSGDAPPALRRAELAQPGDTAVGVVLVARA